MTALAGFPFMSMNILEFVYVLAVYVQTANQERR